MLKYTTTVPNDDGIASPTHHSDLDYTRRTIEVSAGSKAGTKMAIKRRTAGGLKKALAREQREQQLKNQENQQHLPPIGTPGASPHLTMNSSMKENYYTTGHVKRKEIRTPYISHINRVSDVATPYVLHTQFTNMDPTGNYNREQSKLSKYSGNVVEYKHDDPLKHEGTLASIQQKMQTSTSPTFEKRPRGRHGRKSNSFNEHDLEKVDIKDLAVQSNQIGLSKRVERKARDTGRGKADESFSIRKKIEQFRRWHEEQYREKIKKLKQEVDHQFEAEHNRMARQVPVMRDTPTSKNDMSINEVTHEKVPSEISHEKMDEEKTTPNLSSINENSKPRSSSARTWRTWRNVNESYAYSDVQKYIKENELMDEEKSLWIQKWIKEVNKAMKDQHFESIL